MSGTWEVTYAARAFNGVSSGWTVVADDLPTREDALVCAEVAASEHAERVGVPYVKCRTGFGKHTGFTFQTSGGTLVWYQVREAQA